MSNVTAIALSIAAESSIAVVLAILVLSRYRKERQACHLYWAAGLFLVFVTMAEEAAFYVGVWSEPLIQAYLILVALLVGLLSLGSAEISLSSRWRTLWFGYIGVTSAALVVVSPFYSVASSIVVSGVVTGQPPLMIVILSSIVTIPAAMLLILASLYGAIRGHRWNLLYIAAGTVVISAAGGLYIVSFPATLYYAEFVGIVLLFLGFVGIPRLSRPATQPASA